MTGPLHGRVVVRRDDFTLDAELHLAAGTTTALLGPNGAGKSTLLQAVAGLVPLDAGRLASGERVLDDPDVGVAVPAPTRGVGVVFQDGLLFDHLTVRDNVAFGPRSRGADRAAAGAVADRWLARLGIAGLAGRRPGDLSGGEAQRVALARALAIEPEMLLLDEPLAALDVAGRATLRRTLQEVLPEIAGPRVLVTHDPAEAFLLAEQVVVLEDGRVTQQGTPQALRRRPRTAYVADLVGTNLVRGVASGGVVRVGGATLVVADRAVAGPVLVTVHPRAVALATSEPAGGSQRNTWVGRVTHVEPVGDRVRVAVEGDVPLTAEVTPAAVAELALTPAREVWVAVKATELQVVADA